MERIGILAEFPFAPEDLTHNFLQLQTPRRGDGTRPQSIQMYVFYATREKADLVERLLEKVFDGGANPVAFLNTYNWVVKGFKLSTTPPAASKQLSRSRQPYTQIRPCSPWRESRRKLT